MSRWTLDTDPETGLPKLPDGYWWEVIAGEDRVTLWLQLRCKTGALTTQPVGTGRDFIVQESKRIITNLIGDEQRRRDIADLVGKYPPKKLAIGGLA